MNINEHVHHPPPRAPRSQARLHHELLVAGAAVTAVARRLSVDTKALRSFSQSRIQYIICMYMYMYMYVCVA